MIRTIRFAIFTTLCFIGVAHLSAQKTNDASKSIAQVEKELAPMAHTILNGDSTDEKVTLNKEFTTRMMYLLKRPESFDYPFDSLKTVSILKSADHTFRVFTWYFVDRPKDVMYGDLAHYYFGLIQREYITATGEKQYIVIPLMELPSIPQGFESVVTDNYRWFGALYYQPKDKTYIPQFRGQYYKLVPKEGEVGEVNETEWVYDFVPGKVGERTLRQVKKLKYDNMKRVKEDITYYVLTGWNGWNNQANYKVLEVMSFDPEDSTRVLFGAPILYFDKIPKSRALFKYSEYAPFSLNINTVKSGWFKLGKRQMFVYDHLANPNMNPETGIYESGPDGTYDALNYYKKHGGYFEWYRNVKVVDGANNQYSDKELKRIRKERERRLKEEGIDPSMATSGR